MTRNENILIRSANTADEHALAVLAVLDGGKGRPQGDITIAEVDGRMRAAVGSNDVAISDPFWPSAELVSMLRVHHEMQVSRRRPERSRRHALRAVVGV
jgi:hypothetical protein